MSAHARLSPSAAHRWIECPGSVTLEETIPDRTSTYADEGTILHDVVARALTWMQARGERTFDFSPLIGRVYRGEVVELTFTQAHADACASCIATAVEHSFAAPNTIQLVEQRIVIPERDDLWGTSDLIVLDIPLRRLSVIDWKFGEGVRVEAKENPQAIIYALGALLAMDGIYDIDTVRIAIHQPRIEHHDEWKLSAAELRGYLPGIHEAARRTDTDRTTYHDGDWCLFCKAKPICPALRATALAAARREFSRLDVATPDELAEAMRQIPRIEACIRAVEVEVLRRLTAGETVPGFKTTEGRRRREYSDPAQAEAWAEENIGDDAFTPRKLVTPAELERVAKHLALPVPEHLWDWQRGALKVVPEKDARRAMTSAECDFERLPEIEL